MEGKAQRGFQYLSVAIFPLGCDLSGGLRFDCSRRGFLRSGLVSGEALTAVAGVKQGLVGSEHTMDGPRWLILVGFLSSGFCKDTLGKYPLHDSCS